MCSQPSASARPGATVGPWTRISPSWMRRWVVSSGRPAEPSLRRASTGARRRHLRAGLREAVGLDHGRAPPDRLFERLLGHRAAADQDRPRPGEVGVGLEQPHEGGGDQREDGDVIVDQRRGDPVRVEAVVDHGRRAVDHRAHHDPEAGDVAEGQAAEPAIGWRDADVEGGADRAPEEVAVGEADRARCPRAAAGQDPAGDVVHVVLAEQRQVGLGLGQLTGVEEVDARLLCGDDRRMLRLGELRGERQHRRPQLHQGVNEDHLLAARVHGQGRGRAAPHAVGCEASGDPGGLGLELGVADLLAVGDERRPVRAALGSL